MTEKQENFMRLKYVGLISPINLHKMGRSIVTGEIFDCPGDYAAELMGRFNEKGKKAKFISAEGQEISQTSQKKGRGRPPAEKKDIELEL